MPLPSNQRTRTLRVVVHVEEPFVSYNRTLGTYEGIVYTIWQNVKRELQRDYHITETFADTDDFNKMLQDYIRDKHYDLVVGAFSVFPERLHYCAFTHPYVLDKYVLLTSSEINWTKTLLVVIKKYVPVALLVVLIGCVLAFVFRLMDVHVSDRLTISAMFGNRDFLDSPKQIKTSQTHKVFYYVCMFLLMLISTYTYVYLSAYLTHMLYTEHSNDRITTNSIKDTRLLCTNGFRAGEIFEEYGAVVDYIDVHDEDLISIFLRTNASQTNMKHYDGIITSYLNSLHQYSKKHIRMNESIFGLDKYSFVVQPPHTSHHTGLLKQLNRIITTMNDDHTIANICASYFGLENKHLGIL
jgi:ABC-type amino acid transport substrate-binding protein